jgi:pimeloyl-ACP methyl ester carboxylesterase
MRRPSSPPLPHARRCCSSTASAATPSRRGRTSISSCRSWSAGHDLFFYGYDGLRSELNSSAAIFRVFLERLLEQTDGFLARNLPAAAQRSAGFAYDDILIVAHSLGAVIARRALVDAARRPWASRVKLILFAPAHRGARVAQLALEAASPMAFLRFFGTLVRFQSPLIDSLQKDSLTLNGLIKDTERAIAAGHKHLIAAKVVLAEYERIVENETFCDDPPPVAIPRTTHMSVCKPRPEFRDPLTHLEEFL